MSKQQLLTPSVVIIAGCILLIFMGVLPVLFSFAPAPSLKLFLESPVLKFTGKALVLLFLLGIIFLIAKLDSMPMPMKFILYASFLLLSFFLTDLHYYTVDTKRLQWQVNQYVNILAGQECVPHQYRFLPQGILWWMVLFSGDFLFAYYIYRLFFTFAVCLSLYKLSRMYNPHKDSLIVVLLYAIFYPLSIRYYYGNLLDPMFHSIFILALMYCQKRKIREVFFLVTMGMFVKETVILAVPCYYLLNMELLHSVRKKVILKLGLLVGWCLLLFLACRIPFGFRYNIKTINGVEQLMILRNFGRSVGLAGYLHPILFIFMWIPILIFYRKYLSRSLFYTSIYLAVSFYLTNLCFGWNTESRNFVPALCMLLISTVSIFNQIKVKAVEKSRISKSCSSP
ncbi:MAG: hypothetical protein PHQ35_05675 [Phycisphaerae bacterium]|nr:hypothetical protein [Phycisphaerae bacterium]MDD5380794.1 hypothetical protein [Phycisphaerae bacterium]